MKHRAVFCTVAIALLAAQAPATGDVLPPPPAKPLECGTGQVATADHGGTRCEYRNCRAAADCPAGMACIARSETHCDPRGQPCGTSTVTRCSPRTGPAASGARSGCASSSGCQLGPPIGLASWALVAAFAALVGLLRRGRRRS